VRKPSIVLGVSYGHGDSAAAVVVDGTLVAAAEEERFVRVKHYALFPSRAVQYCLAEADISAAKVDVVAVPRRPWQGFWRKFAMGLTHPALVGSRPPRVDAAKPVPTLSHQLQVMGLRRARVERHEHHLAHLASARFLCEKETVALVSLDGLGDFASGALGVARGGEFEILRRIYFPHSLGFFYTAMTQYLGFPHYGDEYKVMGLSSYGRPVFLQALRELVRESDGNGYLLNLEAFPILKNPIQFTIEKGQPRLRPFFSTPLLTQLLGVPPRKLTEELTEAHQDLARSVQARFEEVANHVLSLVHEAVGGDALALAGGCAHNSVWVGKIPRVTPFRSVHVAPASHDAGTAVGAAILSSRAIVRPARGHWALLGPGGSPAGFSPIVPEGTREQKFFDDESLIEWIVHALCDNRIVGLFHGRMEFGPRALGGRSILADPRKPEMRGRLNERIKRRESFRPFAASVLWEHQAKWFKGSFFSPHMEAVFEVQESVRSHIPAVVHVDQTCRVQSVVAESQPFYWNLIEAFRRKTGVPLLINTSFNDNEPIVCTEQDAFRCFLNSDLDCLVVGHRAYVKEAMALAQAG